MPQTQNSRRQTTHDTTLQFSYLTVRQCTAHGVVSFSTILLKLFMSYDIKLAEFYYSGRGGYYNDVMID